MSGGMPWERRGGVTEEDVLGEWRGGDGGEGGRLWRGARGTARMSDDYGGVPGEWRGRQTGMQDKDYVRRSARRTARRSDRGAGGRLCQEGCQGNSEEVR